LQQRDEFPCLQVYRKFGETVDPPWTPPGKLSVPHLLAVFEEAASRGRDREKKRKVERKGEKNGSKEKEKKMRGENKKTTPLGNGPLHHVAYCTCRMCCFILVSF